MSETTEHAKMDSNEDDLWTQVISHASKELSASLQVLESDRSNWIAPVELTLNRLEKVCQVLKKCLDIHTSMHELEQEISEKR